MSKKTRIIKYLFVYQDSEDTLFYVPDQSFGLRLRKPWYYQHEDITDSAADNLFAALPGQYMLYQPKKTKKEARFVLFKGEFDPIPTECAVSVFYQNRPVMFRVRFATATFSLRGQTWLKKLSTHPNEAVTSRVPVMVNLRQMQDA